MQLSVDSGRTRAESRPRYSSASRRIVLLTLVRVGDVAIVSLVGLIVTFARFWADDAPPVLGTSLVIGGLIAANVFPLFRVYEPRRLAQLNHQIPRVLAAWLVSLGVLLVVLYAFRVGQELSRLWVGYWLLCGWGALITSRLLLKAALDRPELRHLGHRAAVVGEAGAVDACLEHLGSEPAALGVVLVMRLEPGRPIPAGELDRLEERLTAREVDQVVLASADVAGVIEPALRRLRQVAVEVAWAPQASCPGVPMLGFTALGDQPLVRVLERPIDGWHYLIKEALDRSVALLALAFLAPLLLLVAVAVRLDSPGPALYRQTRRGLNREPIDVYKFRTMYAHLCDRPDAAHVRQAVTGDPRITRLGRFLRKTSVDELPQLINVLRGEMSLVGPRPHAVAHDTHYARLVGDYLGRHRVKPGVTGWAQVNGLRGETDTLEKMRARVEHDLYYVDNWSLLLDLQILLRTFLTAADQPAAR
jgi:Undecaprenyl-phosphate glucose phosphotransferase